MQFWRPGPWPLLTSALLSLRNLTLWQSFSFSKRQQAVQYNLTLYSPLSEQQLIMMQIFDQHREHQILNLHYSRKNGSFIYVILLIPNCPAFYLIVAKRTSLINMASSRTLSLFFIALFASILHLLFYCSLLLFSTHLCLITASSSKNAN